MAQQHPQQIISRDLLVPPNKQYGLAEANNNIDLVNPLCPPSSKILGNILIQHPLCFALTAFASVPWIYIQQIWHTLRLDDSKEMFIFFTDTKEFTFLVDDFRHVFQLPQATDINHAGFVEPPTFKSMLPFFLNELVEMQGGLIHDHAVQLEELSPTLFKRYDRDIGELFTRSGRLGMRLSPKENQDLRLQLAEERRARLELAEVVDSMRRRQEPSGDV
ncbi:hypothetical protein Tco_0401783 [Tanacetum coccineum]